MPTFCLLVVVIYGLADKLRNFVVGIFVPQYHYPYAAALCFAQVLVSLLFLNLLHSLDLVPLKRYSKSLGEKLLVPAICESVQAVLVMWGKASSSYAGLFPLAMRLLPLLTMGWIKGLKLVSTPFIHITVLIAILSGLSVVITVSQGLLGIEPLEYVYAPLGLILRSFSLTWLAKVFEVERCHAHDDQVSVFDIYYTQLVNQSWVLGLLCLLHADSPWRVLSQGSWCTLLFHGFLLAILLLGMVLSFLVGITALCFSPFAAALLYSARELMAPFLLLL